MGQSISTAHRRRTGFPWQAGAYQQLVHCGKYPVTQVAPFYQRADARGDVFQAVTADQYQPLVNFPVDTSHNLATRYQVSSSQMSEARLYRSPKSVINTGVNSTVRY